MILLNQLHAYSCNYLPYQKPSFHVFFLSFVMQNRADARKALSKNGMQINGVLIIGVKPVDPIQRQTLNERLNTQGFMTLPPPSLSRTPDSRASPHAQNLQNGSSGNRQSSAGNVATPSKSVVSKIVDLMFGV